MVSAGACSSSLTRRVVSRQCTPLNVHPWTSKSASSFAIIGTWCLHTTSQDRGAANQSLYPTAVVSRLLHSDNPFNPPARDVPTWVSLEYFTCYAPLAHIHLTS